MSKYRTLAQALSYGIDQHLHEEELEMIARSFLHPSYSEIISTVAIPDQEIYGDTFSEKRDGARLRTLQEVVEDLMSDGKFRTLRQIHNAIKMGTEASISARLRQAQSSGRWKKTAKNLGRGLWTYQLTKRERVVHSH